MVMTHIKIAEFKSRLSHYLDRIRHGEQLVVTDRKTPIARVLPYSEQEERLSIQAAKGEPATLRKIKIPPAPAGTNSLKALREDRRDDLESA